MRPGSHGVRGDLAWGEGHEGCGKGLIGLSEREQSQLLSSILQYREYYQGGNLSGSVS